MRALGSSIRSRLLLLVLAATLPMLVFSAALLYRAYTVSAGLVGQSALSTARRVLVATDAEVERAEAVGYALSQLPPNDFANFGEFEGAAARALIAAGLDGILEVIDRNGAIVAHTSRKPDESASQTVDLDAVDRVFRTARTQVAGLAKGAFTQHWQVAVHVPLIRDGQVRYDVAVTLPAASIGENVAPSVLPDRWFGIIADQSDRVIWDSGVADAATGQMLAPGLAKLSSEASEGFGVTQVRGTESVLVAFVRSERDGWLICVGMPAWLVRGPALRSIGALAAGATATLAGSLILAWLIGRSIARPLRGLADQAVRVGRHEPLDPDAGRGLDEADAAAQALHEAAATLTVREAEREAALQRAEAGEARLEAEVSTRTQELAESEDRFRTYFEYSSDALVIIRVDHDRFIYETINRSGERIFGMSASDIAGRSIADVLPEETIGQVLAGYREAVAKGEPLTLERTITLPAGTLHLETILVPVLDRAGERIVRILSGSRDLTERKRMANRLAHAQRLEAVGQLTGGVAHDFNNLLTVVIGNLSLLRRRFGDDKRAERYLAGVEAAAERGAKLTASLLAFSRKQALQVEPTDLAVRIHDSTTLLQRALGEEIALRVEIAPGLPPANADAGQLEAAVLNLVINARDAILDAMAGRSERLGWLRIAVREAMLDADQLEGNDEARPGRFLAIEIQDTGVGMTPSVRARAFEPFFTTKEIGRGTGLGLSQVFGFVRQLAGHVTLDSTPGQGTTVTMYLPAAPPSEPQTEAPGPEPKKLPTGMAVLIVEDDDSIRDVAAEILRDAGLAVLTAPDGPAAVEILRGDARIDLLFSDVVMPGGSTGVDLARAALKLRPRLPVLLTSGYSGSALGTYGADVGYDVLSKPYTRAALLERIGAIAAAGPAR